MTEEQVQAEAGEAVEEPVSEADALREQLAGAAKRYRELLLAALLTAGAVAAADGPALTGPGLQATSAPAIEKTMALITTKAW